MADFHIDPESNRSVFGKASTKSRKSGVRCASAGISPLCPQCGSRKLWRDGLRYSVFGDKIQRWLCRNCGIRFSDPDDVEKSWSAFERLERVQTKSLKAHARIPSTRQICAGLRSRGAKNLSTATEIKTVAGDLQKDFDGLIVQFMAYLEKEGYGKESKYPNNLKTLVNMKANLLDPESVKTVIGKHNVKNGAKLQYVYAYSAFCKMLKISWDPPHYKQEETIPFIPDESELNALIYASRSKRMATYLQLLKEIWADPGEALGLRWIDISGNIVTINRPVKGHLPRQLPISIKLQSMLNELPKISERVFPTTYNTLFACFDKVRKRTAQLQKNPRLLSIELRSFRHWGGSMLAFYNVNVLTIKKLLGHKRIENTMKYIWLMPNIKDGEFEIMTAVTDQEIKKAGAEGFTKYDERRIGETVISYYRRPKRFSPV